MLMNYLPFLEETKLIQMAIRSAKHLHGQKIPKSYYLCKTEKKLSTAADAEKITVTRFSKEEISFEVTEVGSYLEWEFETKNKDIGFSLNFRRNA
ncbi:hypothetical protein NPIL_278961, partial [Nephila pilipes]